MSTGPDDTDSYDGYHGEVSVDESDQLTAEDTLADGDGAPDVEDQLDRGYSPPERYSPGQGFGNTPYEEATGETLDQRIAQEEPEPDPYDAARLAEAAESVDDGEVGAERAGRLVDAGEGTTEGEDRESSLVGDDVGIDGAAASAEEAAVHVVPDDTDPDTFS